MNQTVTPDTGTEPVAHIERNGTRITLLGTAHVSRASAEMVRDLIDSGDYDAVAIELCPSRHNAIINPDSLAKMDLFQVIKHGKAPMVAASLALGAYQQRLAEQFDIKPGEEMRAAIDGAEAHKLPVLLIDREIGTTLKRVYRNVPWWKRMSLFSGLFASVVSREKVSEEEIEQLKQGDMLETAFSQFADQARDLYKPLINERDQFMAAHLQKAADEEHHQNILAVVGAGHMNGMIKYLQEGQNNPTGLIETLNTLPPPGKLWKWIPWVVASLVFIGFYIGFQRSPDLGWQLVWDWILINGSLCALGAAIAGAHIFTIIGAFIAAPITSLNPTIGAGMVTASMEIFFRRPQVDDFSQLRQASTSLKGWWKNRVTRTLLVFLLSTFGSAAGTYLAGFRIFERLTTGQ